MGLMATAYEDLPVRDDGFTVQDLYDMPADGRRYELVDGVLLVSPAPRWLHQLVVMRLPVVLHGFCPPELTVLGPQDVPDGPSTNVEPDVIVVRSAELIEGQRWTGTAVLTVEVVSPSSKRIDRVLKREVYQRVGVPSYWIVDADEPSVTVLTLRDGVYVETGHAVGDEALTVTEPFEVTIVPSALVAVGGR